MRQTNEGWWVLDTAINQTKSIELQRSIEWESHLLPHLANITKPGRTVVDVGAHIGDTTISFMRHSGGYVVAYEPEPDLFECLKRNSPHSINYQLALSDKVGSSGYVHLMPNAENWESGRLARPQEDCIFDVSTTTLDAHISEWPILPDVGLIKVDVDGTELQVLRGASETIYRYRPSLIVELNVWLYGLCGNDWRDLKSFLDTFGYKYAFPYGFGIEAGWPTDNLIDWTAMDPAVQHQGTWYHADVYCTL